MSKSVDKAESPEHVKLVEQLMAWVRSEGFRIDCADHEGHQRCPETERDHLPDVMGYALLLDQRSKLRAIGDAKVSDDIEAEHSKGQFEDFSTQADWLYIAVPAGFENRVWKVLRELQLDTRSNIRVRGFPID